jgi:hypothetical protein
MTPRNILTCTAIIAFAALSSGCRSLQQTGPSPDPKLTRMIKHLSSLDYPRGFDVMYKQPAQSTEIIIQSLSPVPRNRYQPAPQVVWQLRALHSLTGLHMTAVTSKELTPDERRHLLDPDTKEVRFFATLMSHDMTWVAPEDAQREIIARWKKWYKKYGADHTYVCDPNVGNWYFY